jgi:antitoxin VapB
MALHIEDADVERLAAEVARLAHESETVAVRRALEERKEKLEQPESPQKRRNMREYFEREVWPRIPPDVLGKSITKEEEEEILGFGPEGF